MRVPPQEAGWPPSRWFLLPEEPDCEAEADNLMSVVHLHGQYLMPIESAEYSTTTLSTFGARVVFI